MSSISIKASMSIQNLSSASGNYNLKSLMQQHDQIAKKISNIENSPSLSKEQKEKQLAQLNSELKDIDAQIEVAQKKVNKEKKQKQIEQEKQQAEKTMDPETAEMMLELKKLMTMAANTDAADSVSMEDMSDSVDTDIESAIAEAVDEEAITSEEGVISETDGENIITPAAEDETTGTPEEEGTLSDINNNEKLLKAKLKKYGKGIFVDEKV